MPVSYIEGFQEIDNYCKNIKLNPKFIISAVGDKNDSFAIWIANNIGKSKYFALNMAVPKKILSILMLEIKRRIVFIMEFF